MRTSGDSTTSGTVGVGILDDGFARLLGERRGTGKPREECPRASLDALTAAARARELTSWVKDADEDDYPTIQAYIDKERKTAADLGLALAHGQWEEQWPDDDDEDTGFFALTAVYAHHELIGFIGGEGRARSLLLYDEPGIWDRP